MRRTRAEGSRIAQMLFGGLGPAKVGATSRSAKKKARLYYGTSFSTSVAPPRSLAAKQRRSVRYVTDAGELLR